MFPPITYFAAAGGTKIKQGVQRAIALCWGVRYPHPSHTLLPQAAQIQKK